MKLFSKEKMENTEFLNLSLLKRQTKTFFDRHSCDFDIKKTGKKDHKIIVLIIFLTIIQTEKDFGIK